MDASKKQREPVAFKSLAELKRFIRPGVEFKTVSHANHADMVGLTRVVTTVQTVGFYSKIKDQAEHPFSTCNHGKGFYTDFGKAGNYIFDGTTVKVKDARKQDRGVIYELEFYDREQNMEETMMDRKMVNFIKEQYPPGTRIRLNAMDDPYAPILPGTEGAVDFVDDAGQLHMKWDNGRSLALIPGEDSFTVLPPKLTTLKLYMPLTADLYERNEYGDLDDSSTLLEGRELRGYVAAEKGTAPDKFIGMFFGGQPITAKEFGALTALRMENTGKVRGVFDVNFDKREFSAVHIMDGWRTWVMRDVSAAALPPNSEAADTFSKALGSRTVLSGSVSRGKNDPSQSLQMMERPLLTADELKSIPKGSFIVQKTGCHPMRTRLRLFLEWGITFEEEYRVEEQAARRVYYADQNALTRAIVRKYPPKLTEQKATRSVKGEGQLHDAPVQEMVVAEDIDYDRMPHKRTPYNLPRQEVDR